MASIPITRKFLGIKIGVHFVYEMDALKTLEMARRFEVELSMAQVEKDHQKKCENYETSKLFNNSESSSVYLNYA